MQIGSIVSNIEIPARAVSVTRQESEFDKTVDTLEIGQGFTYVTGAKDKNGNACLPNDKAQYGRVSSKKWAPKGKTFKVFRAKDQSGAGDLEVAYTVVRVDFAEPIKRAPKKVAAPVGTEGQASGAAEGVEQAE